MGRTRVALVTCQEMPEPDVDEPLLVAALNAAGVEPVVIAWNDPTFDWSSVAIAVLRSCWDYHRPEQRTAFDAWLTSVSATVPLLNPAHVVRWNQHKTYLLELETAGIAIVPTRLVPRSAPWAHPQEWQRIVVKPAVSAGSRDTHVLPAIQSADQLPPAVSKLLATEDVLVQQYASSVDGHGERCLIWIDNELCHAIRKQPRFSGDDEHVSASAVSISAAEAAFADQVLDAAAACGRFDRSDLAYARVDLTLDADGSPMLMELELIEPSLFLKQSAATLDRCVHAIASHARSARTPSA